MSDELKDLTPEEMADLKHAAALDKIVFPIALFRAVAQIRAAGRDADPRARPAARAIG